MSTFCQITKYLFSFEPISFVPICSRKWGDEYKNYQCNLSDTIILLPNNCILFW